MTPSSNETLERIARRIPIPEPAYERMLRRRDRKRRNQRITAGVAGIAVFVAAVWIVTTVGSSDRTQTPAVPGPAETGPTVAPDTGSDGNGYRIPPAGTPVSTPVEGELIASTIGYVGFDGYVIRVYADGRVLWWDWAGPPGRPSFVERRLSPEGVELVRSGADVTGGDATSHFFVQPKDLLGLLRLVPESAWEGRKGKPYVPARYGACFWRTDSPLTDGPLDFDALLGLLPASAYDLLHGSEPAGSPRCLVVTPDEARSLEVILNQARSSHGGDPIAAGAWSLRDFNGDQVGIVLRPLFPDGSKFFMPGF